MQNMPHTPCAAIWLKFSAHNEFPQSNILQAVVQGMAISAIFKKRPNETC
jgi:hypothetical protein